MYDKMFEKENELIDRLEALEGRENDPACKAEIEKIQKELEEIDAFFQTEMF